MEERRVPTGPRLTPAERVEAWLLTGPAGRVYSFSRDLASAMPMLVRYWGGRLARRGSGDTKTGK